MVCPPAWGAWLSERASPWPQVFPWQLACLWEVPSRQACPWEAPWQGASPPWIPLQQQAACFPRWSCPQQLDCLWEVPWPEASPTWVPLQQQAVCSPRLACPQQQVGPWEIPQQQASPPWVPLQWQPVYSPHRRPLGLLSRPVEQTFRCVLERCSLNCQDSPPEMSLQQQPACSPHWASPRPQASLWVVGCRSTRHQILRNCKQHLLQFTSPGQGHLPNPWPLRCAMQPVQP